MRRQTLVCLRILPYELLNHGAEEFDAHADGSLVHDEIAHVQVMLLAFAGPAAQPRHGTRDLFQVPRKVFATGGLRGLDHGLRVDGLGGGGKQGGCDVVVKHRWYAAVIGQLMFSPAGARI